MLSTKGGWAGLLLVVPAGFSRPWGPALWAHRGQCQQPLVVSSCSCHAVVQISVHAFLGPGVPTLGLGQPHNLQTHSRSVPNRVWAEPCLSLTGSWERALFLQLCATGSSEPCLTGSQTGSVSIFCSTSSGQKLTGDSFTHSGTGSLVPCMVVKTHMAQGLRQGPGMQEQRLRSGLALEGPLGSQWTDYFWTVAPWPQIHPGPGGTT